MADNFELSNRKSDNRVVIGFRADCFLFRLLSVAEANGKGLFLIDKLINLFNLLSFAVSFN